MQITVEPRTTGGLAVLPEVPDIPAVLLEGRNGIGKTVLVRLLELLSGKQPFAEQQKSWTSLQERLGATVLTLSNLEGDRTLEIRFTPDRWPVDPVPLTIGGWLGSVMLDGAEADIEDAQTLLWVERFAGNEDLDRTLGRRLDIYVDRVGRTNSTVAGTISRINALLGPLVEQIRPLDPNRLRVQQDELVLAEAGELEAREALENALRRHELILATLEHAQRVAAADDPAAELAARRADVQSRLGAAVAERDEVNARVEETSKRLAREGDAQATLADAERIHRYRAKRLRNLTSDANAIARRIGTTVDAQEARRLQHEAREQLEGLREQRAMLDAGGQTARLIDRLDGLLVSADAEGLNDQDLLVIGEHRFTVSDVHGGMRQRADELRGRPLPEELQLLDRAISEAQRRAARLNSLIRVLGDFARQEELLAEAEAEVRSATESAQRAGALDEAFREDNKRLGQLEEQIDRLGGELAAVYEEMGLQAGQSLEDARNDLDRKLDELELADVAALPDAEQRARGAVESATESSNRTGERAAALRRSVTVVQAAIDGVVSTLSTDPHWSWLAPAPVAGSDDALALFAAGRERLLALDSRLDDVDRLLDGFSTVAKAALNQDDALIGGAPQVQALRQVLGNELRSFLDTPAIREALFDGAAVVDVDPVAGQLTIESSGGRSTRPFESFSTGEQAFAFTQARIRELITPSEPNRLLVLDEFGAFVAADRLPALTKFLTEETLGAICDQVLVILPLQVDYEADVEFTVGALADRYRERADQIAARDYSAVPLSDV
jgi:hypothetical protein